MRARRALARAPAGLRIALSPQEVDNMNNMRLTKSLGMLLLGIWLIVTGLLQVVPYRLRASVRYWPRSPSRPVF